MKPMMTVAGGVFFAVAIMFLILGGTSFVGMMNFQKELESRGQFDKELRKWTGLDGLDKQELERKQSETTGSLVIAAISGSIGVGLAIAGKNKSTQN
ncbi:hypothetical protein [Myxacorys almedinensis]|uniref:Uncharacterized protein n=1 Tax=Myxacorys almedinensis A TaxID=2690445 RepID=A0A8J8CKM6_9CYAN|nr:hypothetical protein [Myxacorys almedinensis]NDJ18771.1 hypothetical protein [Myxacorys almedinensis A]